MSSGSGNMQLKKTDIYALLGSFDELVELKTLVRKISPTYNCDEALSEQFRSRLRALRMHLQPLFSQYIDEASIEEAAPPQEAQRKEIVSILREDPTNMALISSSSAKKILKNLGVDPRRLFVSGGPVFLEDYKKVNPQIPDSALKGIKKKCDNLLNEIKSQEWDTKELYFIYEKGDKSDELTLEKIGSLSELIGKEVKKLEINSWKDLEL
ncbi:MAG: hypothetical protein BAJALOKI1v1_1430007 [Promethearchaeota archaeon]|nr:MAG: hypothetical protein BAJALOKI1v1_1430007 [Candidatus Lokiarchaeota archaeon]